MIFERTKNGNSNLIWKFLRHEWNIHVKLNWNEFLLSFKSFLIYAHMFKKSAYGWKVEKLDRSCYVLQKFCKELSLARTGSLKVMKDRGGKKQATQQRQEMESFRILLTGFHISAAGSDQTV